MVKIKNGEIVDTHVPIAKLHACKRQVLKKDKLIKRLATQLKTAINESTMPEAWKQKSLSLIGQAEGA